MAKPHYFLPAIFFRCVPNHKYFRISCIVNCRYSIWTQSLLVIVNHKTTTSALTGIRCKFTSSLPTQKQSSHSHKNSDIEEKKTYYQNGGIRTGYRRPQTVIAVNETITTMAREIILKTFLFIYVVRFVQKACGPAIPLRIPSTNLPIR